MGEEQDDRPLADPPVARVAREQIDQLVDVLRIVRIRIQRGGDEERAPSIDAGAFIQSLKPRALAHVGKHRRLHPGARETGCRSHEQGSLPPIRMRRAQYVPAAAIEASRTTKALTRATTRR